MQKQPPHWEAMARDEEEQEEEDASRGQVGGKERAKRARTSAEHETTSGRGRGSVGFTTGSSSPSSSQNNMDSQEVLDAVSTLMVEMRKASASAATSSGAAVSAPSATSASPASVGTAGAAASAHPAPSPAAAMSSDALHVFLTASWNAAVCLKMEKEARPYLLQIRNAFNAYVQRAHPRTLLYARIDKAAADLLVRITTTLDGKCNAEREAIKTLINNICALLEAIGLHDLAAEVVERGTVQPLEDQLALIRRRQQVADAIAKFDDHMATVLSTLGDHAMEEFKIAHEAQKAALQQRLQETEAGLGGQADPARLEAVIAEVRPLVTKVQQYR